MPVRRSAKLLEIPIPIRIDKLTEVLRIKGIPVFVHWSVWAVVIFILLNVVHHPLTSLLGLAAYSSVLLVHETGHLVAANKMRCDVLSIRLYPSSGLQTSRCPGQSLTIA